MAPAINLPPPEKSGLEVKMIHDGLRDGLVRELRCAVADDEVNESYGIPVMCDPSGR